MEQSFQDDSVKTHGSSSASPDGSVNSASDTDARVPPLAIVGWSNRFPGQAATAEGFWNLLVNGRTAAGRIPKDRFNIDTFYHREADRSGCVSLVPRLKIVL